MNETTYSGVNSRSKHLRKYKLHPSVTSVCSVTNEHDFLKIEYYEYYFTKIIEISLVERILKYVKFDFFKRYASDSNIVDIFFE